MFCVLIFALVELARSATARFLQSALAQSAQQRSPKCLLLDPTCDRDSDLFTPNYNRYRSPSLSEDAEGDPTVVYMQLLLSSVPSLCTAAQRLSFTALAEYSWHDPRLNLSRVSDNQYVQLPEQLVERIWKPTLSLLPAAFIRGLNSTEDIQAHVSPDQKIVMSFRIYVSLFCKMDLYFYPFDVHVCDMSIVNVGSDDHQSILRWIGDERSPYRVSEQSIYWSSAQSSISNFRCSHILPLSIVDNLRGGARAEAFDVTLWPRLWTHKIIVALLRLRMNFQEAGAWELLVHLSPDWSREVRVGTDGSVHKRAPDEKKTACRRRHDAIDVAIAVFPAAPRRVRIYAEGRTDKVDAP